MKKEGERLLTGPEAIKAFKEAIERGESGEGLPLFDLREEFGMSRIDILRHLVRLRREKRLLDQGQSLKDSETSSE